MSNDANNKATALPEACWDISLVCECPKCKEPIDLMDDCDFWENNRIQACEHGTDASRNVDAYCSACELDFKVNLAY